MRPTADYCHDFTALYRTRGSCRVRVFEWGDVSVDGDDAEAVVVLTDEPNSISSMRYNVEVIAAEVLLRFALPTSATAFVEHHTCGWCERRGALRPETFELVTFEVDEPECREVCPGRFVAALSGPEHHLLSFDVLDELVRPGLLHSVEDVRTQPGLHGGRPLNAATAAPPPVPSPILFSDRFTVVPKIREVCPAGLSAYLIPTYAALADYANNATGLCWPEMETLAWLLGCNEKTVRRHMQKLEEFGLVEKLERLRRPDGTFRGYKYRLPHIARAAERILERREANKERYEEKKREQEEARERRRKARLAHRRERDAFRLSTASSTQGDPTPRSSVFWPPISGEEGARRRREGYEHLFQEAARQPSEGPLSRPVPEASLAASTGHPRPLAPIYLTSRNNHFPPNSPVESPTEQRKEAMRRPLDAIPQQPSAHPDHLTPAERVWLRLRGALLDAHPNLDPRQLSTLSVEGDAPIMSYADPLNPKRPAAPQNRSVPATARSSHASGASSPAIPAPSSNSRMPPELLGVQLRRSPAGDGIAVAMRYSYSEKPPSERQRTRMVRELLLQALSVCDGGVASVAFTGFREDALKRLRTDELHSSPIPR